MLGHVSPKLAAKTVRTFGSSAGKSSSRPAPRKAVSRLPELPPSAKVDRPRVPHVRRPLNGGTPVGPESPTPGSEHETGGEREASEDEDAAQPKPPRVFRGHMPTLTRSRRVGPTHVSASHVNDVPPPVEKTSRQFASSARTPSRQEREPQVDENPFPKLTRVRGQWVRVDRVRPDGTVSTTPLA